MREIDGKKYFDEDEMKSELSMKRREMDKTMTNMLEQFNSSLQTGLQYFSKELQGYGRIMGEIAGQQRQTNARLDKHEEIIHGNGKEGVVTTTAKMVDTVSALANDIWDKDKGLPAINSKLAVIMERKKDYDAVCEELKNLKEETIPAMKAEVGKVKGKINTITAVWGTVSGVVGFAIGKVVDYFILNPPKGPHTP